MAFSREKNCTPPVEDIDFFEVHPLEIHFSSIFGVPLSLEFQQLLLYLLKFSFDILNRGGGTVFFFWKSPIFHGDWKKNKKAELLFTETITDTGKVFIA